MDQQEDTFASHTRDQGQKRRSVRRNPLVLAASFKHRAAESYYLGTVGKALARAGQATPTDGACVPVKPYRV